MTTSNAALLNDALAAPVAWIAADANWTALGVNEFWTWTGAVLPLPQDGGFLPSDRLPALVAEVAGARKSDERTPAYDVIEIDIAGAVIYATQSGTNEYPAATCLATLMTLHDVLTSSDARRRNWNAPSAVSGFDFQIEGLDVVPADDDPESVAFVVGNWSLRIDQIAPVAS